MSLPIVVRRGRGKDGDAVPLLPGKGFALSSSFGAPSRIIFSFHRPSPPSSSARPPVPLRAPQDGGAEYKRQVHKSLSSARLRTLSTQMSYRLDEGRGRCTYHVGVEDDGCHSLLDYPSVSESAWILEGIARSLNAVVLGRRMIQGEVAEDEDGRVRLADREEEDGNAVVVVDEPPVLGKAVVNTSFDGEDEKFGDEGEGVEASEHKDDGGGDDDDDSVAREKGGGAKLCTEEGSYTRCELTIQRVETHLLDPSPLSLSSLSRGSSFGEGAEGAIAATDLERLAAAGLARDGGGSGGRKSTSSTSEATSIEKEGEGARSPPSSPREKPVGANDAAAASTTTDDEALDVNETLSSRNVRVAVVGNVDAGKSTLIGTLTTSSLDDGRGSSRTAIMRHRHEIESGRTSTASSHLLGFKRSGDVIVGRDRVRPNKTKGEDEIARSSYSLITLMDLAGHERYLKTTIHGVSSGMADYALILVNGRHPPTHMTQHHLNLCASYGIPVVVVFTKVDGCPEHALATSRKELHRLLKGPDIGKRPFAIKREEDVATCVGKLQHLAPTLDVSCVTGEGLPLLRRLLFALPKRRRHERKLDRPFEFLVEDVFSNVPGVGSVVSGFVNAGSLDVGEARVYVGPADDGSFLRTVAKSAHIARINATRITAGQSATLAFGLTKETRKKLRRGMVVTSAEPTSTRRFDAEICVLRGEGTTIRESYQAYVHILNVRQTAYAREIEVVSGANAGLATMPGHGAKRDEGGIVLRPGSRAKVQFEFAKRPEYIRPGMRMLFRDGRVRGVGIVTGIPPAAVAAA
ncbi:hypothetical protein ACHAWF_013268 [Thalassiosira exigua]